MILYTDNQADKAIITSPELSIFNPPSNVKDPRLSKVYKGDKDISLNISGAGSAKNISQEYTNLIEDPCDLTTANWTDALLGNTTITDQSINGHLFSNVTCTGSSYARDCEVLANTFVNNQVIVSGIIRRVNNDRDGRLVFDEIGGGIKLSIQPNFDNKTFTVHYGTLLQHEYLDNETAYICGVTDTFDITAQTEIRAYVKGVNNSTMFTEIQVVDDTTTMYPFTAGTHSADVITEAFTMPDRFTLRTKFIPNFRPSPTDIKTIFTWQIDYTNELLIYYNHSTNRFILHWEESGVASTISSGVFDDGTTYTNLNQPLDMIFSFDFVSNTLRFVIMLGSGKILDANAGSIPNKLKNYPTLSIGNRGGGSQADSSFEYLRIYEGLLTGDVSSSSDVDNQLKDKKILLDKTYQQKIKATDLLIAGSTINDGDKIILQGNNVDSWGTGTPLYESVVWSKDIIKHHFIESNYQYYRLSVNSSNDIEIGRIYLGGRYATAGNHVTVPHDRKSASSKTISVSGQSYMDGRYKYSLVSTKWPILTETQNNEILEIFDTIDIGTPFFVTFDRAGSILGTMYVTIDEDGLKSTPLGNRNFYTMGMDFRQEV